jgi:hypothetical protein
MSAAESKTDGGFVGDGLDVARIAAPGGGALENTQAKVAKMKAYAQESGCSQILQDLFESLVVEQPDEPLDYLIQVLQARKADPTN